MEGTLVGHVSILNMNCFEPAILPADIYSILAQTRIFTAALLIMKNLAPP